MHPELNGIIVVDKPADMTSARVVAVLKKMLAVKKMGHTGTLDPFATGVMVCCVNKATKLARFFLNGKKKYDALLHLGIETDTQDFTGNIISTCEKLNFSDGKIKSVLNQFEGTIEQIPPVFSALKHKGVPLYKLARAGKPVRKSARHVFISNIKALEINLPDIRLEVSCSAGTYIRTLCSDIGKALGCGGHLKTLRRTENNGFTLKEAVSVPEIETLFASGRLSDRVVNMTEALRDMPEIVADTVLSEKVLTGHLLSPRELVGEDTVYKDGFVKIINKNKTLIAVIDINKTRDHIKYCCVFS